MSSPKRSLVFIRRDLRLEDNRTLLAAASSSSAITMCFVADPRQLEKHPYRSEFGLKFLTGALLDLSVALEARGGSLHVFRGKPEEVVDRLLASGGYAGVFHHREYTPFGIARDNALAAACAKRDVACHAVPDVLLHEPEEVKKSDGKPYTVFTPFFNRAVSLPVASPESLPKSVTFSSSALDGEWTDWKTELAEIAGGDIPTGHRKHALKILSHAPEFSSYDRERDFPALDATTHLSAHLKFGTVSVREVHATVASSLGNEHPLIRQLHWRDFFTHIAFHVPRVFGHAFHPQYDTIRWSGSPRLLAAWKEGKTGFPIVDAGMRELAATGRMHNRVRMVVASFLVKDLHVDWREGEKHFARLLEDYDPAVNNGNWQWAASTGCDAQPWFRIFNPWLQQKRFDPDALYVKRWIPELASLSAAQIHKLERDDAERPVGYPAPIVDHAIQSAAAKEMYAKAGQ